MSYFITLPTRIEAVQITEDTFEKHPSTDHVRSTDFQQITYDPRNKRVVLNNGTGMRHFARLTDWLTRSFEPPMPGREATTGKPGRWIVCEDDVFRAGAIPESSGLLDKMLESVSIGVSPPLTFTVELTPPPGREVVIIPLVVDEQLSEGCVLLKVETPPEFILLASGKEGW